MIGIWMLFNFKRFKMCGDEQNEILHRFPFMILFGVIVAFVLDAAFTGDWRTWLGPMKGRKFGFTFTGWLLGVIAFIAIFGKCSSFGRLFLLNLFLPVLALAQAIGRIGCFLGGCCYGVPCAWGVHYPVGSLPYSVVGDIALMPVQLFEAGALLLLFVICLLVACRFRAVVYLVGVGAIRFVAEFFRYDHRGDFFGLSTMSPQQYMSVGFTAIAVMVLIAELHNPVSENLLLKRSGKWRMYGGN